MLNGQHIKSAKIEDLVPMLQVFKARCRSGEIALLATPLELTQWKMSCVWWGSGVHPSGLGGGRHQENNQRRH
jgi:hypothetical protein